MSAVNKVLIVGGGFSGMSAAIRLRQVGIAVDLVELDPKWQPLGAGLTVSGPTLRALDTLGLYDEFKQRGQVNEGVIMRKPDGTPMTTLKTPQPVGSRVLGGGAIMRPVLADMLAKATRTAGVDVRLGCTWKDIQSHADRVDVTFTDGSTRSYDLLIGADGVHSTLRAKFFPEISPPGYIGQGVWRAVFPRPPEINQPNMWLAHHLKLGFNPVSTTHMYMYVTEDRPKKEHIDQTTWPEVLGGLMGQFSDPIITKLIPLLKEPGANIDYRPLANLLVPAPWNRGRVILIGDTVAATTPHLASGAGIGIESGIVLAEELGSNNDLQTAFDRFHERRFERCRRVVKDSERIAIIEIEGGDKQELARIMAEAMMALAQPI